ncbi:unnamed protein product [Ranitomeya imitator]|uniref:RING-type domain-containing protein n=1 Tax=Ranitomeya imitator TaxID=111125 RepID=A0ABN9MP11_9NEOB|nr:unnamed protein product [Ranitomeya imitator]
MELEYSVPECPICFATYDNVFKTPLLLPCSHTFCMECLSKLCIFQKELETFCCPMCRAVVTIPTGGIPKLPPNMNIAARFPPWMVWRCGDDMATVPSDPEEHIGSLLECPICYVPYDNVFKTPLILPCSHTFCMECLSRLCLFLHKSQEFPCPFCRILAQIPPEGVPKMQPDLDVVAHLPPEMRTLQDVWADGCKLCWRKKNDSSEGRGSVVTLHLLSSGGEQRPAPGGLIVVQRTGCRAFFQSVWGIGLTILTVGILLFAVLFLPIYLNQK